MRLWLAVLIGIVVAPVGPAGTYDSKRGYHLTCPDGWRVDSAAQGGVFDVIIKSATGSQTFGVAMANSLIKDYEEEKGSVERGRRLALEMQGYSIESSACRVATIGARKAIECDTTAVRSGRSLHEHYVSFNAGSHNYLVWCIAPSSEYDQAAGGFNAMLASFTFDEPDAAVEACGNGLLYLVIGVTLITSIAGVSVWALRRAKA
jgi:hypothetical protein